MFDLYGEEGLLQHGFVPGGEEELSVVVAVEVSMGIDKRRVAVERVPRLANAFEAHEGLDRQPGKYLKAYNFAWEL